MTESNQRVVKRLRCWWLGCEPRPQDPAPPDCLCCAHCGEYIDYSQQCGVVVGRYYVIKNAAGYWLFKRWFPKRCADCGKRYGDHSGCIPF